MADTTTTTDASNGKTGLTDAIREAFAGDAPLTDKAKALYKAKPAATIAIAAVAGLALLNTIRGKR